MWSRKTTDPLGKLLFENYGMHVLGRPRENVSVFQVFGLRDAEAFQSGDIDGFLRWKFDKPKVEKGEVLLDIDTTISDAISGDVAVNFLQGFLTLVGAGVVKAISVAMEKSQSRALRFRFGGCTRDYVKDGFELEWKLSEIPFVQDNSAMKEGCRYYIATGVHYCDKLTFEVLDKNAAKVDLSADVAMIASGKTGLKVERDRQITATSDKTLAYGVELNEIVYDKKHKRLHLQESGNYVHTKAGEVTELPKAMVGGPDDSMILRFVD
jgi:hypothetical protein